MTLRFHVGSQDMQGKVHCPVMIVVAGYLINYRSERALVFKLISWLAGERQTSADSSFMNILSRTAISEFHLPFNYYLFISGSLEASLRPSACRSTASLLLYLFVRQE